MAEDIDGWPRNDLAGCCDCVESVDDVLQVTEGALKTSGLTAEQSLALIEREYAFVERWAHEKTGGQFGVTKKWVRPCVRCGCTWDCSCGANYRPINVSKSVHGMPIQEVSGFRINGEDVDPINIRVDNDVNIVRHSEDGSPEGWPYQDYSATIGSANTWEVELCVGTPPNSIVLTAITEMVCERVKQKLNLPCKIPDGVSSITERVGTGGSRTYSMRPPSDTNSGVESWNVMCSLYAVSEDDGPEGLWAPGGFNTRTIGGSRNGAE